jgi:Fe-S oxidoreductase
VSRIRYAIVNSVTQRRTFRKRPWISLFHACIFYGFIYYLLVNLVDGTEGYLDFSVRSTNVLSAAYNFSADLLSVLVLVGIVALVLRRFMSPARRDFRFNPNTLLHEDLERHRIARDSLIVSLFILFHVGSRAVGAGARIAAEGPDPFQPFATLLSHGFSAQHIDAWRVFGYWGALGSVLAFLIYFPHSKHIHIFMAPAKYMVGREASSGTLPAEDTSFESASADELPVLGAKMLEDLVWPRLLDAYACIQCNRCQDVCPATITGKSLSPAALEINKRMELNKLARSNAGFIHGEPSPRPLLEFALSPEAAWACTTCGACMQVCPVQNEQMLDIIDIRRNQVMIGGEFPVQLQSAFRGMERSNNPWGIRHDHRMAWAEGLAVKTIDENPDADVLYWVGCAPSYDPHSQKTARALVQLLDAAGVNFAVLGKKECCTGDGARRAGNEYLYNQLARQNIATLNTVNAKTMITTCPHCLNSIGHEYRQLGGNYNIVHHTEYLESLVRSGKLQVASTDTSITYHDPCYLGRHNGVYDAPRNLLRVLTNDFIELPRRRENSFCCGAGGAQFWKEEEPGPEKIPANRFREVQQTLSSRDGEKILAVGCPFCKTMLNATPESSDSGILTRDVAELMLEGLLKKKGVAAPTDSSAYASAAHVAAPSRPEMDSTSKAEPAVAAVAKAAHSEPISGEAIPAARKKWNPSKRASEDDAAVEIVSAPEVTPAESSEASVNGLHSSNAKSGPESEDYPSRKKWSPKRVPAKDA